MGLLKWIIEGLDYVVTLIGGWVLCDVLYQLGMHLLLHMDQPWDIPGIALGFRPNLDRFKLGIMVVKKAINYISNM